MAAATGARKRVTSGGNLQALDKKATTDSKIESSTAFEWSKLLNQDYAWDKDELGDVLHWLRQIIGLLSGIVWGIIPLTGGLWFIVFLIFSFSITFLYYKVILAIDEEEYGGHSFLILEGSFISVGVFLLTWVLIYNLLHFP